MQIIRNIEQGSEEWMQLRMGVATASNFNRIISSTGKRSAMLEKYALELASQQLLSEPEPTYKNDVMQRGNDLEDLARDAYCQATFTSVEQITMFKSDCGNFGYSPDGLIGEEGLIEIKCPIATTHTKYLLDKKLPSDYIQQVQGGLWISGRKWCDFVSFHPGFKTYDIFVHRVGRDEDYISKLEVYAKEVISQRDRISYKITNQIN